MRRLSSMQAVGKCLKPLVAANDCARGFMTSKTINDRNVESVKTKPFSEMPGFRSFPVIGTSWIYIPIIGHYKLSQRKTAAMDKKRRFGDVFREKFGSLDIVVTCRAEDMEAVARSEGMYPTRGELETLKAYRESRKDKFKTTGLLLLKGPEWLELRQKIQKHMLKPKAAESYLDSMQEVAGDFVERIYQIRDHSKEVPDLLPELYKWALESIAFVGLDARLGCLDKDATPDSDGMQMIRSVSTQFECMFQMEALAGNMPYWKYFNTPTWKRFVGACDTFVEIAFKYINKAVDDLKAREGQTDSDLTVLQALLVKEGMDASDAVTFLADMFMAGIETTSTTIGYLLYNLARNPEKQEILYEEIKRYLPSKKDHLTQEMYQDLKYLRSCLKESMRLNATVGGSLRKLASDSVIDGYNVPAGTAVVVILADIFKNERYFTKANEFLPGRWLKKEDNFNPYAFLPFGFGTRSCIGRRLAELEMICLITEIIRNFKVEYHHEDIGMRVHFVSLPDKPLRFKFIER